MKFEGKPIERIPTCAMCGTPVKDHNPEHTEICIKERRKVQELKKFRKNSTI